VSLEKREKRKAFLLDHHNKLGGTEAIINIPDGMQVSLHQIHPDNFFRKTYFLHPEATFKSLWDIFVGILIIYSVIEVTYRLSFGIDAKGAWRILSYTIDSLFAIDILITFRTSIWLESNIIIDSKVIAKKYLKGWFWVDFTSTVPINDLFKRFVSGGALKSTRLIKAFRLIRLVKVIRLLKMSSFFQKYEDSIPVNPTIIRFCKLFMIMTFAAHLYGCIFYSVAYQNMKDNNWVEMYCILGDDYEKCLTELGIASHYLAALYWAFTTMTTVGYGDILPHPDNMNEIIVTFVTQVSATTLFAYIIGNLVNLVLNLSPGEKNRKRAVMEFNCFLSELTLTSRQRKTLRRHYNHRLLSKPEYLAETDFLDYLPMHLRIKAVYFLYRNHLKELPVFGEFERRYRGFLAMVLPRLKPCLFSPGEQIVTQYICAREMYFVLRGNCIARYNDTGKFFRDFHDGEYFAEATLTVPENQSFRLSYNVKAQTRVQAMAMSQLMFMELNYAFPEVFRAFEEEIIVTESRRDVVYIPFTPEEEDSSVLNKPPTNEQAAASERMLSFPQVANTIRIFVSGPLRRREGSLESSENAGSSQSTSPRMKSVRSSPSSKGSRGFLRKKANLASSSSKQRSQRRNMGRPGIRK